ncbi:hypothetical protein OROMI_017422 [Orobanche minor]
MANRSTAMIVTNIPAKDLAYTNFAYCSRSDLQTFFVPGSRLGYASIGDVLVLTIAAYDKIPREVLWWALAKKGVSRKYIDIIKDMYEGASTSVRTNVGRTEEFPITIGVHQGSALSPFLFAIVMDELTRGIQNDVPWCMMFADDIVLIDETKVGVQQKLELWRDTLEARGFRLSRSKTEYMECRFSDNSDREAERITFDGKVVHGSTFFRYLGSIIQKDGELDGDVAHRIKAGWLKWKSATGILCDPDMPHRLKGKFYRTAIRPALLYGTECWAVKQCHVQKMNVAEMRMLRWMCGHTKKDRLRNEVIREKVRVASIEDKMMENRLRWFGHCHLNFDTLNMMLFLVAILLSMPFSVAMLKFIPPENFNLALLTLELEFVRKGTKDEHVDAVLLSQQIRKRFMNQVMTTGQRGTLEYHGNGFIFTVNQASVGGQEKSNGIDRGMICGDTYIIYEASNSSGIKIVNQREAPSSNIFRHKEFNLQSFGIGGLSEEFADIFRRAFASRVFPPHVTSKLGIKHVKGMLLYGPPGTGKTLMARQIGKMLNGKEPKIVNGPEVLSKFVGETEKNVRDLFADAEHDQRTKGDQSELHIIIFDEIDAICKSRGSTRDGTGVHDSIVNQLLTKIDGVESLNNVLLIGMTNRKDLLDEALLRPGRLEVQVEISLPDENGRLQILQIHTNKMKECSFLAPDVNLEELGCNRKDIWRKTLLPYFLPEFIVKRHCNFHGTDPNIIGIKSARTKNYSGAELEGVVKSAVSYALNRQLSMDDLTKPVDEESIKVTMDDFLNALHEVIPAFGASTDDLERCRLNGIMKCVARHDHIYQRAMLIAEQVKVSRGSPLVTCLLEGPSGSGKTAMAATVGIDSDFPYVKIISAETMIGLSEPTKCAQIVKVFEDAYRSPLSIIILDDIERLLEYVAIGPRFSNLISQTLLVLLKRLPPKGKKVLVIGTTSEANFLESVGIRDAFSVTYHVPTLKTEDAKKVLQQLNVFSGDDIESAAEALNDMPLKKLYMVVEMAAQGEHGGSAEAIYSGKEKINLAHFYDCLQDIVRF